MKAVQVRQWGGFDAANIEDVERPQPAAGEVLVKVRAASVNVIDWMIREGYLAAYVSLPYRLGSDFAGDVEALGEGVTGIEVGTPVYGMKGIYGGSFAEYVIIPAADFAPKPKTISYQEAASVPQCALTAWQALFDIGKLAAGQRVLIHAAAGGVGHFAVQFAKVKGAYVIATGSADNEAFVRGLGADEFVDYNAVPFETVVKDVDLVIDTVGFDTTERSCKVLKPGHTMVSLSNPAATEIAAKYGMVSMYYGTHPDAAQLAEIAGLIDAGKVKPHINQIINFDLIHEAIALSQGRHIRGKVVVNLEA